MSSFERLSWEYRIHHKGNGMSLVERFIPIADYYRVKLDSLKAADNEKENKPNSLIRMV